MVITNKTIDMLKVTGIGEFLEFEATFKSQTKATKFVKSMVAINKQMQDSRNPKPYDARMKTHKYGWKQEPNDQLKAWRERNKLLRLTIKIERI